jgi:hypothetical protein
LGAAQTMQSTMSAEDRARIREIGFRASHFVRQASAPSTNTSGSGGAAGAAGRGDGSASGSKEGGNSGSNSSQFDALAHNPVVAMQQKMQEGDGVQPMDTTYASLRKSH